MKRDLDLIRKILLALEDKQNDDWLEFSHPDYSQEEIDYNSNLIYDAGLADGMNMGTARHPDQYVLSKLTWQGHEFLDASRDDSIWEKAKSLIKTKVSTVSFQVFLNVLTKLAEKELF